METLIILVIFGVITGALLYWERLGMRERGEVRDKAFNEGYDQARWEAAWEAEQREAEQRKPQVWAEPELDIDEEKFEEAMAQWAKENQ